jgi:hypothetical protein
MTKEKPGGQCCDDITASLEATTGPPESRLPALPPVCNERHCRGPPAEIITISEAPIARGSSKACSCSHTQLKRRPEKRSKKLNDPFSKR